MDLPSSKNRPQREHALADIVSDAVIKFETELNKRHNVACAREGISYAIVSGKLPPYMRWQMDCRPNLGDPNINKEFQELWKTETRSVKDEVLKSADNFMDDKISHSNNQLKEIRVETISTIGKSTPAAGLAKTQFNEKTRELEKFDRHLMEFKMNIRSVKKSTEHLPNRRINNKREKTGAKTRKRT